MISRLKKIPVLILLLLICCIGTAFAASTGNSVNKNVKFLFVQVADEATLEPVKAQSGTYTLTLNGTGPNVIYFSDKPNRIAGVTPIENYLKIWQPKGPGTSPNVFVSGIKFSFLLDKKRLDFVFSLSTPVYNADKKTISYVAKLIKGDKKFLAMNPPLKISYVYLFVDSGVCWGCK